MAALPATPRSAPARVRRRPWGEWLTGYAFVLPATLVIGVFGLFPIFYALYMSVHRWRIRQGAYLGLQQYERTVGDVGAFAVFLGGIALIGVAHWLWTDAFKGRAVAPMLVRALAATTLAFAGIAFALGWQAMREAGDARFLLGLTRTFYYGFLSVPVQILLAIVLASLLYQRIRGKEFYRMLFFLPYVTPVVAGAAVFRSIFNPREERLANTVLSWIGVEPQRWLFETRPVGQLLFGDLLGRFGIEVTGFWAGPSLALLSIILFGIWTYTGYNTVIFLAGLGGIPKELYEAAEIDGASGTQRFAHITVPLLAPVTFYLTVLGFIGTFQAFTHLYVMREPAVRDAVDTASLVIFDTFYARNDFGTAAAQSVVLFLIILAMTLLQNRLFGRRALRG
ncbi:MAG: carbohydrate ABC transporter permease [Trueperaceae bacterium]